MNPDSNISGIAEKEKIEIPSGEQSPELVMPPVEPVATQPTVETPTQTIVHPVEPATSAPTPPTEVKPELSSKQKEEKINNLMNNNMVDSAEDAARLSEEISNLQD